MSDGLFGGGFVDLKTRVSRIILNELRFDANGGITIRMDPAKPDSEMTVVNPAALLRAARDCGVAPIPPELERAAAAYDEAMQERRHPLLHVSTVARWPSDDAVPIGFLIPRLNALIANSQVPAVYDPLQDDRHRRNAALDRAKMAKDRGRELIRDVVTHDEWRQFDDRYYIEVRGTQWLYRLRPTGQTHFRHLTCGCLKATACLELRGPSDYPAEDRVVAEYMLLKNDELRYLRTVNISWLDADDIDRLNNEPSIFQEPGDHQDWYPRRPIARRETVDGGRQIMQPIQYRDGDQG